MGKNSGLLLYCVIYVLLLISYVGEGFEEIKFKEARFVNIGCFGNVLQHKLLLQKTNLYLYLFPIKA